MQDLYVSYKVAIYNVLNKQIVNIYDKIKALYELFDMVNGSIFKKYFAISNKNLDTHRYKKSKGKLKNTTHYNHAMCSKHAVRNSCSENPFCKWSNEYSKTITPYDKFKLILQEEYEYKCKLFLLRSYYPNEFHQKELPIRFINDFYKYHGFSVEILNKYDKRSPEFTKNVLIGYDVIRKEVGLKPLFSFKNIIKPEFRKLFKKDSSDLKKSFEETTNAVKIYSNFIQNILNMYNQTKLINSSNSENITFIYDKDNTFMMRIQEEIQNVLSEYESRYIRDELNISKQSDINSAIKYMWSNRKDDKFLENIQNHELISMSQNITSSSCKLYLHIDEFNHYMKKAIEQMIREPQRRLQILTNTFKTYNQEEPYIKKQHELIFSNEDINKLLQSDISEYELSQFVNDVRFFDITYSNEIYSKHSSKIHIDAYNGIDIYNKNLDTDHSNISKDVHFSIINTTNKNKSYLNRGGNKMTNIQLNKLKKQIDFINKSENVKFLNNKVHYNIQFTIL